MLTTLLSVTIPAVCKMLTAYYMCKAAQARINISK